MSYSPPVLTSLGITPQASTIALGQSVQYRATGVFSDGTSRDETQTVNWKSGDASVVSLDTSGMATSHSVGTAAVTAQSSDLSASATLTVSKAAIVSIAIDPSALILNQGASAQLKAMAVETDGSKLDVTNSVTWTIDQRQVAAVTGTGMVSGTTAGTANVTASTGSVVATCSVTVTAPALLAISIQAGESAIPLGSETQLKASGTYSDGSIRDLTSSVKWSSTPTGVVVINNHGLATGKAKGKASIQAQSGDVSGSVSVTVIAAALVSIEIRSGNATIPLGAKRQLTALGTYTDGTTADLTKISKWSSDPTSVIQVSTAGDAHAMALGTATISANTSSIVGKAVLTVGPPTLTSIVITPVSPTVSLESSLQLTSLGVLTDGTTKNLTSQSSWTVADQSVVRITGTGNATGQKVGSTLVTATSGGIAESTTIVVQPVALVAYFSPRSSAADETIRATNPGGTGSDLCAMIYVFDQDQQMSECCGCTLTLNGLRTLSLTNDLLGNPLTGVPPTSGTVMLVTSDAANNSSCTPSSLSPDGLSVAWATHLSYGSNNVAVISETEFSRTPLPATLASALKAQCMFIEQLGSGQGGCTCGGGD